jgi:hypothetical protein
MLGPVEFFIRLSMFSVILQIVDIKFRLWLEYLFQPVIVKLVRVKPSKVKPIINTVSYLCQVTLF